MYNFIVRTRACKHTSTHTYSFGPTAWFCFSRVIIWIQDWMKHMSDVNAYSVEQTKTMHKVIRIVRSSYNRSGFFCLSLADSFSFYFGTVRSECFVICLCWGEQADGARFIVNYYDSRRATQRDNIWDLPKIKITLTNCLHGDACESKLNWNWPSSLEPSTDYINLYVNKLTGKPQNIQGHWQLWFVVDFGIISKAIIWRQRDQPLAGKKQLTFDNHAE